LTSAGAHLAPALIFGAVTRFFGADGGIRTRTRVAPQRFLRPRRLPFRHVRKRVVAHARAYLARNAHYSKRPGSFDPGDVGAEDGIRTRDLLLGKEMLYH
jgi:hypothetical protein